MDNLISFVLAGGTEFTPEVLLRFFIFFGVLELIGNIITALIKAGGR